MKLFESMSKTWKTFFLLELDYDVYLELLRTLLDVVEEENNDLDALVHKKFRIDFDCE